MKIIDFKDLYFTDFNVCELVAINKKVENDLIFDVLDEKRTTSVFVHLKDCNIKYVLEDGSELYAPKGSIIYIPHCAKYHVNYQSCDKPYALAQLAAFELRDKNNEQFILSDKIMLACTAKKNTLADTFDEAVKISDNPPFSYTEFRALLYSIIGILSKQYTNTTAYPKEFYSIAPVIDYLQKKLSPDVTVPELADMCHISESCFRRLFKACFGVSPSEYLITQKIKAAKKLLQSNMYSISEVSRLSGYDDPAYFSKVFKKQTGITPMEYRLQFKI